MSNILRVPFEVIKQRSQANRHKTSLLILRETISGEVSRLAASIVVSHDLLFAQGPRGLYRGYFSTIAREVPFSFIQYPLWEFLKVSKIGIQSFVLSQYTFEEYLIFQPLASITVWNVSKNLMIIRTYSCTHTLMHTHTYTRTHTHTHTHTSRKCS